MTRNPTTNTEGAVTDVAAIARGLTKAQRDSLIHAKAYGFSQKLRAFGCGPVVKNLAKFGCVDSIWGHVTPLGLAVRNHLTEQGVTAS